MWQYRNYSDELYHHKYIERISVPGGYKYVYPDDKKGSGSKLPAVPITKNRTPNPRPNVGAKVKTSPASMRPLTKGSGTTIDLHPKQKKTPGQTLDDAIESVGSFFDKAKDTIKNIIESPGDVAKGILDKINEKQIAERWGKVNSRAPELYGKKYKSSQKMNDPIHTWGQAPTPRKGSKAQTR